MRAEQQLDREVSQFGRVSQRAGGIFPGLRFLTAGESHGPALTVIVEGLPAGLAVDRATIDADLKRRQGATAAARRHEDRDRLGRGPLRDPPRQDASAAPSRSSSATKDHANWADVMSPDPQPPEAKKRRVLKHPRPGHADLSGALKYLTDDLREVLERASARETTARVAAGGLAKVVLAAAGIEVRSHVIRIGSAAARAESTGFDDLSAVEESPVRCVEAEAAKAMIAEIDKAKKAGDTVGGVFEVVVRGVPPGLGTFAHWDRRLDGRLAQALMSIHAVKAVSLGAGFRGGDTPGSAFHDEILFDDDKGLHRPSNRAGGLEGGITNGEELRAQAVVKPFPLLIPLRSVDLRTKEPQMASVEAATRGVPARAWSARPWWRGCSRTRC
jgi:chorismate synthase